MNPNSAILDQQFLEPVAEVAGLKLQPFSPGVLTCARKLDLKIIVGTEEEKKKLSQGEQQFEIMAVLYMLANDRQTVLNAVASPGDGFTEEVEKFEFLIPVSEMGSAIAAIQKIIDQANLASVEVIPKPAADGEDAGVQPPPNS